MRSFQSKCPVVGCDVNWRNFGRGGTVVASILGAWCRMCPSSSFLLYLGKTENVPQQNQSDHM